MTSIKELFSMVKEMDDQLNMMKNMTATDIGQHGFKFSIVDDLCRFTKDQIKEFTPEVIMNIRSHYGLPKTSDESITYDEEVSNVRENLLEIYDGVKNYQSLLKDHNKIMKDVENAMNDYANYLSSDEAKEKDAIRKQDLIDQINNETDLSLKASYQKKLDIINNTESLRFIYERMEKLGKKELDSIVESFFDKRRFSYIIQKYENKATKLGYKSDMYKSLIDIEEKFLGEDYYPFNNLFLFIMIRFIAYSDVDNAEESMYCQSIILKISKLIYHRYKDDEKIIIVNLIKYVDDYFQDYKDIFQKKNEGNPLSSYRIELEKKRKEESLDNLKAMFFERHLSYDEDKTYEENLQVMHDIVEREQLINWFDIYKIEYPENASLEELKSLKDSFNVKEEEDDETKEESSEEKSDSSAGSSTEESEVTDQESSEEE